MIYLPYRTIRIPLPRQGLAAFWPMREGTGTNLRDMIGGHDATISGATWTKSNGVWTLDHDGSTDICTGPSVAALRPASVSVGGWIKLDVADTSYETIISNRATSSATNGYLISHGAAGTQRFNFLCSLDGSTWGTFLTANADYSAGTWYHVMGTFTSGAGRLYIDGVEQTATSSASGSVNYGTDDLRFCADSNGFHMDGSVNYFCLYDRALSAAEVAYIHRLGMVA